MIVKSTRVHNYMTTTLDIVVFYSREWLLNTFFNALSASLKQFEVNNSFRYNLIVHIDGIGTSKAVSEYLESKSFLGGLKSIKELHLFSTNQPLASEMYIKNRRLRIIDNHKNITDSDVMMDSDSTHVLLIEDDTILKPDSISKIWKRSMELSGLGLSDHIVSGVQIGRWAVPIVGAWDIDPEPTADCDCPETGTVQTIPWQDSGMREVTAAGFYFLLVPKPLYLWNTMRFHDECFGPDVCFGIDMRLKGYITVVDFDIKLDHLTQFGVINNRSVEVKRAVFKNDGGIWKLQP